MLSDSQIQEIRSRFRIFRRKIYLNSCSQGALSNAVQIGLEDYIASWHEQGAGINSVASALSFQECGKVVMGEFEFPTMGHVWLAQRARGADVRFIPAEGNTIPSAAYEKMVDRNTLIVPLTHVCFKNGYRSEVKAVAEIAHRAGALVMLDDYQDCGTRPVDVKAMNLDFYVTGTLKYLLGPPGLAFMYVRKGLIASLAPTVTGWFAQTNPFAFDPQNINLSPTARRFESGSPAVPNIYAAACGLQLLREIGMENIAAHIKDLTQALLTCAAEFERTGAEAGRERYRRLEPP